jgi:hypothetical protein
MTDLDKARSVYQSGNYSCVLCKGEVIHTNSLRGIAPMVEFISNSTDLKGFAAADKIVGKAAAMLFALAGVSAVYADVMSETAIAVFEKYQIQFTCSVLTENIINRTGTGLCPMEEAVKDLTDPLEALDAIKMKIEYLKSIK